MAEGLDWESAERRARERNLKQEEKYPLFRDQLVPTTAADIKKAVDSHNAKFQKTLDELQARGDEFKEKVRALVGEIEFQALESRRLNLPRSSEYHAEFWRSRYEERCPKQ